MIAAPYARRTTRVGEIVGLLGHSSGGRPSERLMQRLGMPVSDDTILRRLKRDATVAHRNSEIRVVGIDDWSWRQATSYGPSSLISSAARLSIFWAIEALWVRPSGCGAILRSKSSAGTAAASMRRLFARAHHRRDRSPIDFTWSRIFARPSKNG